MKYISTRGKSQAVSSAMAIKKGLCEDGGLYFPDEIPSLSLDEIKALCDDNYPARAAKVMYKFLSDEYTYEELLCECEGAYCENSFPGGPAPISKLGERIRVLELWHGPTAAFKDMALQIMPRLFVRAVKKTGDTRKALILVATSGDTGKAALEGYKDVDGVGISVFYPVDGVSRVQKLQMATQEGKNVEVNSVIGNFDDAQNGVKKIFSDSEINAKLNEKGVFLSSANSINWGRLVPQVVYYISAYCDLLKDGDIALGEEIDICVPTGNFGNILAAYIAKLMGLPVHSFICASNKNNVLTDFFVSGNYNRNRPFYATTSPSMDILISSNLERLLYLTCGQKETETLMNELKENGSYTVTDEAKAKIGAEFTGLSCDEDQTAIEIKHIYEDYNYLCDTHTAVGLYCAENYIKENNSGRKLVCASTASPYKFSPAVLKALTGEVPENELDAMELLEKKTGVPIPKPLYGIAKRKVRFDPNNAIKAEDMPLSALNFQRF
ncbi:MAG: threonine synthase [Clostridia bacterium]|nr:threonine synthase [Clostridia bacterium]